MGKSVVHKKHGGSALFDVVPYNNTRTAEVYSPNGKSMKDIAKDGMKSIVT